VSNPKVFEFAKEIGMETLALMDKIREWKLPVKSHMAELGEDVMEDIKSRLSEEMQAADKRKKTKKSKTVKKVTAKKKTAKTASPAPTTKKKTTIRKAKVTSPEEMPVVEVVEEIEVKKANVIRRKTVSVEPVVAKAFIEEALGDVVEVASAESTANLPTPNEAPLKESIPEVTPEEMMPPSAGNEEIPIVAAAEVESAPTPVAEPPPRKVLQRRNIVGRMDLSRVSRPQSAPSAGGGAQQQQQQPYRQQRTSPAGGVRSLRTGFVAPAPMEPIRDDREVRRKDDREVRRQPVPTPGPESSREEEVPQFTASEFRKREMVFQPKKKRDILNREPMKPQITTPKASKRVVKFHDTITVQELAMELGVKLPQVTKVLMNNGVVAKPGTGLDYETASLIAADFGFEVVNLQKSVSEMIGEAAFGELGADRILRSPVVTVMGHVDHGKTTLLDAIRNTNVVSGEKGGITQHIGAYQVKLDDGTAITFIDTPGHEAFTAMRARGAQVTDIAIIVVAADDGIMPQTVEAVSHAKSAGVQILVAINKMDRPNANPDRVKQQLAELDLVPEDWGGQTMYCEVSALKREGIENLLERIHLIAEIAELRANPQRSGTGIVIESKVEKGRGNVATILVKDGTVRVGDPFVIGMISGRIRSLLNDQGKPVTEAGPSTPVQILGLPQTPMAGDQFDVCRSESEAQKIAQARSLEAENERVLQSSQAKENIFAKFLAGHQKELPIVLKADVAGSIEAIRGMFAKLGNEEVKANIIHSGVGAINESDILLAKTSGALVVGFNVRPDTGALAAAKTNAVEVKTYGIVYELVDEIKKALSGLLTPDIVEKVLGRAQVRETFSVPKLGTIAGCFVVDGKIVRSAQVRLLREGRVIYSGRLGSLKRFKDDAKEVANGYECGMGVENYNDIKIGDEIEAYVEEKVSREL
jgi:translation initiation factor IF-2